jgi:hypothetical protein
MELTKWERWQAER